VKTLQDKAAGASTSAPLASREAAARLAELVGQVARELHPHRKLQGTVSLDQPLDADLGFDSLGRAELLFRIEQAFDVVLPDQVLASAETSRDLLREIMSADGAVSASDTAVAELRLGAAEAAPESASTLPEVLEWHLAAHPDRPHITFFEDRDGQGGITYAALGEGARQVAGGLRELDLRPGQAVAIMLPTGADYFFAFYGVLLAGGIPTPIYPPFRPSQIEDHLRRHMGILSNALAPILITLPEAGRVSRWLQTRVETLRSVVSVAELRGAGAPPPLHGGKGGDIALLQYTSGSTGNPKGVVLTHANLLANIRAIGRMIEVTSNDVFVSWLPLYHDMGLIGACLGTLYYAVPLVLMSPLTFMARPERWLWAVHRHRGTLTAGVNFAFELCLQKIRDRRIEGLELGSLRVAMNGAEPISPDTLLHFQERFARYGLRPDAVAPVFGLAESSVGLTLPPLGREPVIDRVLREPLLRERRAVPAGPEEPEALRFVACGYPLPGHQIRVVDESDRELGERQVGRLQFKGPSATTGYFRNSEATAELFHGEWLESGDLAYIAGGDIYPTSRSKDIIIRAGRNLHPHELEHAVGELEGIRSGCVAVFGSSDPASGTERLVVAAETPERDPAKRDALTARIEGLAVELMGSAPDDIVLVPPHSVLKTSSGKIRRAAVRELYEVELLGRRAGGGWARGLRLGLAGFAAHVRHARRRLGELAYGAFAYSTFLPLCVVCWLVVALLPRPSLAWPVTRCGASLMLWLARVPLRVGGLEHLPRNGGYVMTANHASYVDSLILAAVLPVNLSYVAKGELEGHWISRIFVRRLGCELVERFDAQQGLGDARRIAAAMGRGRRLMFYPEGTFTRAPGLRPFYLGAFTAAAEGGVPVIPVALRGTRSFLRDGWLLPRRAAISVQVFPAIAPEGDDFAAAVRLRDAVRAVLLAHCGEPDLEARE
jgi:1-acyl-sn-glycerol-3-phosphate acyltransferase